jgi:hypothetical protein
VKTRINRIRLAFASSMLVLAAVVGVAVPSSAAPFTPVDPCDPSPVAGEDGEPVVFCTPGGTDTVSPVVHINNPTTTTVKRGQTVLITSLGIDNVGVVSGKIYVNGVLIGNSNGSTAAASWTPTVRGQYTIMAEARDAAGNVGRDVLVVTVR